MAGGSLLIAQSLLLNPCDTGLMSIPPKLATARVLLDDYPGGDAVLSWVRRFKTDERHVAIARRVVFDIA
jgi:hypothetical protein